MAHNGETTGGGTPIRAPRGTRDLYPEDLLRRRYLTKVWRDTAIRHGFEEIDGPSFEQSELYAVKSGEGILGELFQAYSGKSPEEVDRVRTEGHAPFALRPEFTPTGARMYVARAAQLGRPVRWFNIGPRFRAERPQRGRLREFVQFDCDVLGDDGTPEGRAAADADAIAVLHGTLGALVGRDAGAIDRIGINNRGIVEELLESCGVGAGEVEAGLRLLDGRSKMSEAAFAEGASRIGLDVERFDRDVEARGRSGATTSALEALEARGYHGWLSVDASIVRGLAYYTGTVFEVIAEGERAIAGGGRYDGLIELLGGPRAPAVGFAMGDVVLSLLLEDKGLMPEGRELMEAVSRPAASVRPDLFVVSGAARDEDGSDLEQLVTRLVADARRGVESESYLRGDTKPWEVARYAVPPLHARTTDKSTRNIRKLLGDAERQHARFAAVVHEPGKVQLKDLDRREEVERDLRVDPGSEHYVGLEVARRLGRIG